jgi:aminopeptidase N
MVAYEVMESGKALKTVHKNDQLVIYLQQPAKTGSVLTFQISYMGVPEDGLIISKNRHGDRTFFADNWPNRAHNWLPLNDVPGDKASVEFIVTAPAHYKIISNGTLVCEEKVGSDKVRTHWKEEAPIPTKVMVIGAARFAVARVDSSYAIPVTAWVYPQDSASGFYDYALADDILGFFETYIGPYPFKKLANVQSKTMFGGMENASAIFYAENTVTGTRKSEALLVHEIVHQWFGNTATEKSFAHLWLSEGFATYLTDVYIERKYGRDSFTKRLQDEREQVIKFAKNSARAVVDSTANYMDLLNANSYQKGGWVLHMLRSEVGDSLFKRIIQTYYGRYKWSNADTRDFQKVVEDASGKDFKVFFDQWLYRPGVPELQIKKDIGKDGLKLDIVQVKNLFQFPLEIAVTANGKTTKQVIFVKGKETTYKLEMKGVSGVVIDPDKKLLYAER